MDIQLLVNNGNKTITVNTHLDISVQNFKKLILKKSEINYPVTDISNIYLTYQGNILSNQKCISDYNINPQTTLYVHRRIKGGIIGNIFKTIISGIFSFLKPIAKPLYDIIMAIVSIVILLVEVMTLIPKMVEAATNIFNPTKLIDDVLYGSAAGINKVLGALIDSIDLDSANPRDSPGDGPFGTIQKGKPVCVPPTMVNIIFLILCPPLALFLHSGIKGFFQVIICSLLTLKAYYFPGLIYAALHILC